MTDEPRAFWSSTTTRFRLTTAALLESDGYDGGTAADGQQAVERLEGRSLTCSSSIFACRASTDSASSKRCGSWGEGVPILMISGFRHRRERGAGAAPRRRRFSAQARRARRAERSRRGFARAPPAAATRTSPNARRNRWTRRRRCARSLERMQRVAADAIRPCSSPARRARARSSSRARVHELSPRAAAVRRRELRGARRGRARERVVRSRARRVHGRGARSRGRVRGGGRRHALPRRDRRDEPALQQRLLRVLQEREVTRVGSTRRDRVDVRVVAATNRDLRELGRRRDVPRGPLLSARGLSINVPPLRERRADIPLLVEHALSFSDSRGRIRCGQPRCSPLAMRLLRNYDWPGNVRQLFGRARARRLGERQRPHRSTAPARRDSRRARRGPGRAIQGIGRPRRRARRDRNRARAYWRQSLAGRDLLGMGRTTLWRKMRAHGIGQPNA